MAKEKSGNPISGIASGQQDLKKQLRELIEDQGDYNNLLKQAVQSLESADKHYVRIASRIDSINKDTINVKEVNKELRKLNEKRYIAQLNYNELLSEAKDDTKNLLRSEKLRGKSQEEAIQYLKDQGDLLAVSIYAAQQNLEIAQQKEILGQQALENEKKLAKSIGITGTVFKNFAEKLGVGDEYYEQMVTKARMLNVENKKLSFGDKAGMLGKAAMGGLKESLTDPLTMIPLIGVAVAGVAKGLKSAFDYIVGIQDQTVKFARAMNLSTKEARKLKMEYADLSISSGDLFITSQKMAESQMELGDALGITNRLSNDALATNIKLKDIAGLELEVRQGIFETATISGKTEENTIQSIFAQVEGLKKVTGIQFQNQKILKEAATLSGFLGLQFSKYPDKLTKSLLTVKAMGLELKQLDSIADSFLDFESSISAEFEAQLITGKEINLNKARELFLNNDLAGAALEMNRYVGSSNDFLKMNRIEAESLAKAFGMSRDQLGDMLKKQEVLSRIGAKNTDSAREQLKIGLEKFKNQQALEEAVGKEAYQNMINASLQERIAGFMDKIKQSISDFVENSGIIDKLEGFFDRLSKPENIKKVIAGVRDFFASAVEFIGNAAYYILEGLDYVALGQIPNDFIKSIQAGAENMGAQIRSMGGNLDFVGPSVSENKAKGEANFVGPSVSENKAKGEANVSNSNQTTATKNQGFQSPTFVLHNYTQVDNETVGKQSVKFFGNNMYIKSDGGTGLSVASGGVKSE